MNNTDHDLLIRTYGVDGWQRFLEDHAHQRRALRAQQLKAEGLRVKAIRDARRARLARLCRPITRRLEAFTDWAEGRA